MITVLPNKVVIKLQGLGINTPLSNWVLGFLMNRTQSVRLGKHMCTHDCTLSCPANHIIKFADDATVLGIISNNKNCAHRREVRELAAQCSSQNLALNIQKTREMILDFSRSAFSIHSTLHINIEAVERIFSFRFLGLTISGSDLSWNNNLRNRKSSIVLPNLPQMLQVDFNHCAIDLLHLLHTLSCLHPTHSIIRDSPQQAFYLFNLLPSGKKGLSKHTRMKNRLFSPHAVRLLIRAPLSCFPCSLGQM